MKWLAILIQIFIKIFEIQNIVNDNKDLLQIIAEAV
jgi:hypothetical protein